MSGKLASSLRELRIHLCQTGKNSEGIRNFIAKNYVSLKKQNPNLPILIRECQGVQPRLWARYDKGSERSWSLNDMRAEDIKGVIDTAGKS